MVAFADKPLLRFTEITAWERFLETDPPESGVRLVLLKKAATIPGIRREEALDVALCFGWIDGQSARGDDDDTVLQSFSPRRKRSTWSQINVALVERLIAEGRMRPSGQAEIDRAKADGRWGAAYRQKGGEPPGDLLAAIEASPAAAEAWVALGAQNRFAMSFRTVQAVRPETRARRIATFVGMLERGERIP